MTYKPKTTKQTGCMAAGACWSSSHRRAMQVRRDVMPDGVGVSDRGVLNQPVNLFCVLPIRMVIQRDTRFILVQAIEASLRDRSCIPCTEVFVVGGYKLKERRSWS